MALTPDEVRRIADLARLDLPEAQVPRMQAQLNAFFDIVERMRAVDTRGIEPLATPLAAVHPAALRLREDEVVERPDAARRAANQHSAPATAGGLYLVPKVIE